MDVAMDSVTDATRFAALPYRAGVGAIICKNGRLFVGERVDTPGAWQFPQGGIDEGEQPLQAVLREVFEETGLTLSEENIRAHTPWLSYDLPADVAQKAFAGRYRGQRQTWFVLHYDGPDSAVDLAAHPHREFARWAWMSKRQALVEAVPFKKDIYQQALTYLAAEIDASKSANPA